MAFPTLFSFHSATLRYGGTCLNWIHVMWKGLSKNIVKPMILLGCSLPLCPFSISNVPVNIPLIWVFIVISFESCYLLLFSMLHPGSLVLPWSFSLQHHMQQKCVQLLLNGLKKSTSQATTRGQEHITPVLKLLCLIPMRYRVEFKVLLLVSKCRKGLPTYPIYFSLINPCGLRDSLALAF